MPNGVEIHLGFTADQFDLAQESLGVKLEVSPYGAELEFMDDYREIHEKLRNSFIKALTDMGFQNLGPARDVSGDTSRYILVDTPAGKRTMVPFELELAYDPGEMGDTPECATLGVALSGRYFPTFLDYRDEHGTLTGHREIDFKMIEVARQRLAEEFPIFKDAKILVVEKFY